MVRHGTGGQLCPRHNPTETMSTTGKRYIQRTHDRKAARVLDATTKTVLNTVLRERRGHALAAYLLAKGVDVRGLR